MIRLTALVLSAVALSASAAAAQSDTARTIPNHEREAKAAQAGRTVPQHEKDAKAAKAAGRTVPQHEKDAKAAQAGQASAQQAPFANGTYSTTITKADAPASMPAHQSDSLAGKWTIAFNGMHYVAHYNGTEVAVGDMHSMPGNRIHFDEKDTGSMACHMPATYHFVREGHNITFHKVSDECAGRVTVLTSHTFAMDM